MLGAVGREFSDSEGTPRGHVTIDGDVGVEMLHRILIIEHPPAEGRASLQSLLTQEDGFDCERSNWDSFNPEGLRDSDADLIAVVTFAELNKPLTFLQWLRTHPGSKPIFAVLPGDPPEDLLRRTCETADDFVFWPVTTLELHHRLRRILGPPARDVESVRRRLKEEAALAQLVGNDTSFLETVERIPLVASSGAPALLLGETGTGKELFARAIHRLSRRHGFPFIPVDCGAVPEHLVENELFGHARGAFTDAHADQKGLVAMAEGGTLFLDEIDALSVAAQGKLLRFLQEETYRPLGSERFMRADVRVIAASNQNLELCVQERQFRPDLYFRLNVLRLHLPPLRERRGDIALLAGHFLRSFCQASGLPRKWFAPASLRVLELYDWPGNVRELFNVVHRALLFSPGCQILPSHLPVPASTSASCDASPPAEDFRKARVRAIETFERLYVEDMLRKHRGNVSQGAREAGKDRRVFGRLVKKYKIDRHNL